MEVAEKMRYALSDLTTRKGWSTGTTAVVTLACAVFLLVVYAVQQHLVEIERDLELGMPRRIAVECPDVARSELAFDAERLAELRSWQGVEHGQPVLELGLRVELPEGSGDFVVGESVFPDDPLCGPDRLEWGRPVGDPAAREAVLPVSLLRKLGGRLGADGPVPGSIWVEVARTRDGREQRRTISFDVVGVLHYGAENRIHLPHETLCELDAWCAGMWSSIEEDGGGRGRVFDHALAYVPVDRVHLLEQDISHLGVTAEESGRVTALQGPSPAWIRLSGAGSVQGSAGEHRAFVRLFPMGGDAVTVVALREDDPRWTGLSPELRPGFGDVICVRPGQFGSEVEIKGKRLRVLGCAPDLTVGGDLLVHSETLAWLAFEPLAAAAVERWILFETQSDAHAREIERARPGTLRGRAPFAWSLFALHRERTRPYGIELLCERLLEGITRGREGVEAELVPSFRVSVERHGGREEATLQFVPDELLLALTDPARVADGDATPALLARGPGREPPTLATLNGRDVTVVGELRADQSAVWLPTSELRHRPGGPVTGIALWSRATDLPDVAALGDALGLELRRIAGSEPRIHRGAVRDLEDDLPSCVNSPAVSADRVPGLRASLSVAGRSERVLCVWDGRADNSHRPRALVSSVPAGLHSGALSTAAGVERTVELVAREEIPEGLVVADWETFVLLAWDATDPDDYLNRVLRRDIRLSDLASWQPVLQQASEAGLDPRPLSPVSATELIRFEIRDPEAPGGVLDEELVRLVRSARASIQRVVPYDSREGRAHGRGLELTATGADDPARFGAGLLTGGWISSDDQVVLGLEAAESVFPGSSPSSCVGRKLRIWFAGNRAEIPLDLSVAGVATGDRCYVAREQLDRLHRWDSGELVYDPATERLLSPADVRLATGALRAVLHARSLNAIAPLVERLQERGYIVRHRLEQVEGVRRMARRTWLFAGLLVGSLTGAGLLLSWSTSSLHVRARRREIGILCALGAPRRTVLEIQVVQGALMGGFAFAAAVLIALPLSLWVRAALQSLEGGADANSAAVPIWAPQMWPLYGAAFIVAVGCPIAGALLGAWSFVRQPVLRALREAD